MLRWSSRHAFLVLMFIVLASCSGSSGCGGCSGCGLTPLSQGFPQAQVITNAAAARVTRPGLDFFAANIGTVAGSALGTSGGLLTFPIPDTTTSIGISVEICSCNPPPTATQCVADVNVAMAALHIDAIAPNSLTITGTIPVKVDDITVSTTLGSMDIGVGTGSCNGSAPAVSYANIPVNVVLPFVAETQPPRTGYTKIDVANATITATIDSSIIQICGGLLSSFIDLFKSFVVSEISSQLQSTIKSQLESQLCTMSDPSATPSCPVDTEPSSAKPSAEASPTNSCGTADAGMPPPSDAGSGDGGATSTTSSTTCVFVSDPAECLPTLLGTDGHLNLGTLLSQYSPGSSAAMDMVFAAGGNASTAPGCAVGQIWNGTACATDPMPPYAGRSPNGLTLSLLGGLIPQPQSACVPAFPNPLPTGIPTPDELTTDTITPWPMGDTGPDVSLAIAGRYLNYAAASAYNAGALCLGVTTESIQALNTGYVSAIIPSLKDLTFEPGKGSAAAAMAITTRPQKPPTVALGGGTDINKDPLLSVTLPQFAIDFYVWSDDRFVRAFTYTADLTIPVNLQTGVDPKTNPNGGILPVVGDMTAANSTVTNSDLIWEDPGSLASSLSSLLSGLVGKLVGSSLSPIDLSSALSSYGIALTIPDGGIRKLTKGTDDFLGIFTDLSLAPAMAVIHAQASIESQEVDPQALVLVNADRSRFPKLHLSLSSTADGSAAVEYTWWIDDQPHAAWTRSTDVVVDSQYLFLQGKHTLYASARVVGHPESEDRTPASVPFLIDVIAPYVWFDTTNASVTLGAYDFVSDASALRARYRVTDPSGVVGNYSEWMPLASVPTFSAGASVEAQVVDEAGNVGEVNGLIRGQNDPTLGAIGSACGCSTPGSSGGSAGVLAALGVLAGLGVLFGRRRRAGVLVVGSLGAIAAGTQGCGCGASHSATNSDSGCGTDCNQICGAPNLQGLIGSYTSVATASDGTVWVAGYNEGDVTNDLLYGDLVAGKYDAGKSQVDWVDVDGLPPAPDPGDCAPSPANTWRNGLTDPGPDVGLWTSIQVDAQGDPLISYYDATNLALKFASSQDGGKTWASHTVMQAQTSDIGRYSKLLLVNGKPTVAFLVVEPGTGGWAKSRVVVATGNVPIPAAATDWGFQDALVDEQTPCRAQFCPSGQYCFSSTMTCQPPVTGCMPADCGASTAGIGSTPQQCLMVMGMPTCSDIEDSTYIDTYPDAAGDYIAMQAGPNGLALVVYDRTRGNLVGVANQGGMWNAQILDGQTGSNTDPNRVDTGDVGIGASLTIAANGDWNVSYVNGWTEALQFLTVPGGNISKPGTPEVVDNGQSLGGQAFADGQHIVGDDSSVSVDSGGTVRIVYQDATAGTLREATGAPASGGTHTWTAKALSQPNRFAGYFPHYVPGVQSVANWFRATDHTMSPPVVSGDVAFVGP